MVEKEKAIENLNKNIEFIKLSRGLSSDSELCRESGIRKGTLSSVRNNKKVPMVFPFFKKLCDYSGYGVLDLLNKDLAEEYGDLHPEVDESLEMEFKRYEGVYGGYYFETPNLKGRENKDDSEALCYAVVLIYSEGEGDYRAVADFGLTREEQEKRYHFCFTSLENGKTVRKKNFKSEYINHYFGEDLYYGTVTITEGSIILDLESSKDRVTMMMNKVRNNEKYFNGAIAATVSVCKGNRPVPVMQAVGLSKGLVGDAPARIAYKLYMGYPSIKCQAEDEMEIFQMFRFIFNQRRTAADEEKPVLSLSEEQERILLHEAITRAINRTVKRNLARTFRITEIDDGDWDEMVRKYVEV